MARLEGTASFKADGEAFRLVYNNDAFVAVEDLTGASFLAALKELAAPEPRIKTLRALLWAGLQQQHPGIDPGQCGDWILAGNQDALEAMGRAVQAAMPQADEGDEGKAADGTGSGS